MLSLSYNDGLCPGGRRPRLILAKGGEVRKFAGENIPGFCAIAAQNYTKNGKWSDTTFDLELAPGVRGLHFLSPLHGTWGDDMPSWGAVAESLGLPVEIAQEIVRAEYPSTGKRLDALEEFALSVEAQGGDTETVVVSFGSPTNRASREGYWTLPKTGRATDGTEVIIRPGTVGAGEAARIAAEWGLRCGYGADNPEVAKYAAELAARVTWNHPEVVAPLGAKILSSRHSPGMHGGHWAVEVAVPVHS